jgi:hypothetical protein
MKSNEKYEILTPTGWKDFTGVEYTGIKQTLKINLDTGKDIICTPEHKLKVNGQYVPAQNIKVGDVISSITSEVNTVVSIDEHGTSACYDLVNVESEDHSFVIQDNLISSNCDELAFVNKRIALEFWTSVFPTLSCVTYDTIILTRNGFMKIGDVFEGTDYKPGDYFKLEDFEVWGKFGFEKVSHGYISPASQTIIVGLKNGQSVEVTKDHPLFANRNGGEMVRAEDLKVGDQLRVDKGMMVDFGGFADFDYLIQTAHENPEIILNMSHGCFKNLIDFLDYKINCDGQQMMNCFAQVLNNYGYDYDYKATTIHVKECIPRYRTEWVDIEYITQGESVITYDFTVPSTKSFLQNGILGSNTGGSCIITSTPTDDETLFADIWKKANETMDEFGNTTEVGTNGFKALKIKWDEHPERGEEFKDLMIKQFGEEKFRREHELDFVAEDETLISPLYLSEMKHREPIKKTGQVRWYKKLDRNKVYFIGYDPSLGTGGDNSAIEIFEFPSMEQVGEWMHNKSDVPTQLKVLKNILKMFEDAGFEEDNVRWTLENNSIGEAPLVLIEEYGEDEFFGYFMSEPYNPHQPRARSRFRKGFYTSNSSKLTACTRFKRWVESDKMLIHSKPLIKELKGFVSRGRTYKARAGDNDDLVMSTLLCVRMAMITMQEEDEYMDALGVGNEIDDAGDDGDNDWDQPLPVVF